jgi:hypothetical protein
MVEIKEPPPGVQALQINNKQMNTYALKTGEGRKETLANKLFKKVRYICYG